MSEQRVFIVETEEEWQNRWARQRAVRALLQTRRQLAATQSLRIMQCRAEEALLLSAQRVNAAKKDLLGAIDIYIRGTRAFDSRSPLTFRCPLVALKKDPATYQHLTVLRATSLSRISLEEFIAQHPDRIRVDVDGVGVACNTPFQGDTRQRVHGYFRCGNRNCGQSWESLQSWRDRYQRCKVCFAKCFPIRQHPLSDKSESTRGRFVRGGSDVSLESVHSVASTSSLSSMTSSFKT